MKTAGQRRTIADLHQARATKMRADREVKHATSWNAAFEQRFGKSPDATARTEPNAGWDKAFAAAAGR